MGIEEIHGFDTVESRPYLDQNKANQACDQFPRQMKSFLHKHVGHAEREMAWEARRKGTTRLRERGVARRVVGKRWSTCFADFSSRDRLSNFARPMRRRISSSGEIRMRNRPIGCSWSVPVWFRRNSHPLSEARVTGIIESFGSDVIASRKEGNFEEVSMVISRWIRSRCWGRLARRNDEIFIRCRHTIFLRFLNNSRKGKRTRAAILLFADAEETANEDEQNVSANWYFQLVFQLF